MFEAVAETVCQLQVGGVIGAALAPWHDVIDDG
jgi:hypothetical protein